MKRNDWILIGIGLLASVVLFGWTQWSKKGEGGKAVVFVDKKEYATYDLHKDGEYEIQTDRGNNWLVIQDGKADMVKGDVYKRQGRTSAEIKGEFSETFKHYFDRQQYS